MGSDDLCCWNLDFLDVSIDVVARCIVSCILAFATSVRHEPCHGSLTSLKVKRIKDMVAVLKILYLQIINEMKFTSHFAGSGLRRLCLLL